MRGFIDEYNNGVNFIAPEDEAALSEDGTPQVVCAGCGALIDFDYPKCPRCGSAQ